MDHEAILWLCSMWHFDGQGHPKQDTGLLQVFFFFFQFSHAELSCEIYVYCLLGDHTYLPGLKLRKVIKVRGKGAMKVITTLWMYWLWSLVSKSLCWKSLISPRHFLNSRVKSVIQYTGSYACTIKQSYTIWLSLLMCLITLSSKS